MAFYVGQKVVCVNAESTPGREWLDAELLVENAVYSVREIRWNPVTNRPNLLLNEIRRNQETNRVQFFGYAPYRFRPLVEKKTDISIFTKMLTPTQVNA